jgi:hypothetical protein
MRRVIIGLVALAVLAPPAFAQYRGGAKEPTPEEIEKKREVETLERQYKSTLERTNRQDAPARTDPWANMRGTSNPPKR